MVDTEHYAGLMEGGQGRQLWLECFSQTSHGQGPYQKTEIDGPNKGEDLDTFCDHFTGAENEEKVFEVFGVDQPDQLPGNCVPLIGELRKVLGQWTEGQETQKDKWVTEDVRAASKAIIVLGAAM